VSGGWDLGAACEAPFTGNAAAHFIDALVTKSGAVAPGTEAVFPDCVPAPDRFPAGWLRRSGSTVRSPPFFVQGMFAGGGAPPGMGERVALASPAQPLDQ